MSAFHILLTINLTTANERFPPFLTKSAHGQNLPFEVYTAAAPQSRHLMLRIISCEGKGRFTGFNCR